MTLFQPNEPPKARFIISLSKESIRIAMRRIIICGVFLFPRGGAYSNYLQYLSDALAYSGYNVTMLCNTNREMYIEDDFIYHQTRVVNICYHGNAIVRQRIKSLIATHNLKRKLKSLKLSENDLVIFPAVSPIAETLFDLKKSLKFKTAGTPLEWFGKEQYLNEKEAAKGERLFRLNNQHDLLFPISNNIAKQFPNVRSMILPIMADTGEYGYSPKNFGNTLLFVLPANGMMKDALEKMLLGIAALDSAEIEKIQFHFTGIKEETVKNILGSKWDMLKTHIEFHKWMKYEELVQLYKKCHFLFLAREKNQMTVSNFPSKVPEVMTYGVVPVCSRVGDYTQYYLRDNVDSLIFDGCEIDDCTKALRRAINLSPNRYQELSSAARRCVEERFDYHKWAGQIRDSIESVFEEALNL